MASAHLSLSWKDHASELSTVCKSLLENNFLVDCTLAADGKRLKAHRLILSACSPYFQMLFGEESEKHPIVFLKDVSFDTLQAILHFIYHGETEISEGQLDAFLALAASLQIKGLNDSSKKNGKPNSCGATGKVPHSSSNNSKKVLEIQNTSSASQEESRDNLARQRDGNRLDEVPDVAPSKSSFQGCSDTLSMEVKPSLNQSPHVETSIVPRELPQSMAEPEPFHEVLLVPKHEQVDEDESDEVQEIFEEDSNTMGEDTSPAFGEQHFSQFSGIAASSSESGSLMPGAFSMPQMTVPPDAQGAEMEAEWRPAPAGRSRLQGERRCPHCHKMFSAPSLLKRHLRIHTGERPFLCGVCGAAFTQSGNLKMHERTHTGERPYRCDVCGAAFIQNYHLKEHVRTHTGERPFVCEVCGATFTQCGSLKEHVRMHTERTVATSAGSRLMN